MKKKKEITEPIETKTSDSQIPEVEVVIVRHKQLFDLLQNPRAMWRVLLSLFFLVVIIFVGLAFVVISIKRFYPYNMIETTPYGATLMKNEDKDVIYWLFNSADLWANSGIEVDVNDELTIRASGSSYTAVHHLVMASNENRVPQDQWVSIEGQTPEMMSKMNQRDIDRARFRISPTYPEGILLMQVIPVDSVNDSERWYANKANDHIMTNGNIEVIGKERRGLRITKKGILHFAVNDIVFTQSVVDSMYNVFVDTLAVNCNLSNGEKERIKAAFKSLEVSLDPSFIDSLAVEKILSPLINSINVDKFKDFQPDRGLKLGAFPRVYISEALYTNPLINELVYYKISGFKNPWYVDNLGSFLVVIERKK